MVNQVMDTCERLLRWGEAKELHAVTTDPQQLPKCTHNQIGHTNDEPMNFCSRKLTLFHQLLVSPNPLNACRHTFQWLHCIISMPQYDYGAH